MKLELRWPDSRESFQGSRTESLFFCESRLGPLKNCESQIFRDSETTLEIKFALLRGGGPIGVREEMYLKTLFFVGNTMTIKF